jgi:hypothetical protein
MIDKHTGKPIRVSTNHLGKGYIRVPLDHLDAVRRILLENKIEHWVDHYAVSVNDRPAVIVINLSYGVDPAAVQQVLDRAA